MELQHLPDAERLAVFHQISAGCKHLWSKNKLQEERFRPLAELFSRLAFEDPRFLAHLTSYVATKTDDKDLKVLTALASTLSDADGTPIEPGSNFLKPNWREVGQAAFLRLDPKLALRVLRLSGMKFKWGDKPEASHQSLRLKRAARAYLKYREANTQLLEGAVKAGFTNTIVSMYRSVHMAPSAKAASILRWKQKPGYPGFAADIGASIYSFDGMSDVEIANHIISARLSPLTALGSLRSKVTPPIASALLEVSSPNQAVILTELFEKEGLFAHKEITTAYQAKVSTASALDRVDNKKPNSSAVHDILTTAKAEKRKDDVKAAGFCGKVFLHIDISSSMHGAIEFVKRYGSVIAECIPDPVHNFRWGVFNNYGAVLQQPTKFTADEFRAILYGIRPQGMTNCMALWQTSREWGADIDIFITDQGHNQGPVAHYVNSTRQAGMRDPSKVVIYHVDSNEPRTLSDGFKAVGIDVSEVKASGLVESALVTQSFLAAIKGATALVDEIMATPLLVLPKWYSAI